RLTRAFDRFLGRREGQLRVGLDAAAPSGRFLVASARTCGKFTPAGFAPFARFGRACFSGAVIDFYALPSERTMRGPKRTWVGGSASPRSANGAAIGRYSRI